MNALTLCHDCEKLTGSVPGVAVRQHLIAIDYRFFTIGIEERGWDQLRSTSGVDTIKRFSSIPLWRDPCKCLIIDTHQSSSILSQLKLLQRSSNANHQSIHSSLLCFLSHASRCLHVNTLGPYSYLYVKYYIRDHTCITTCIITSLEKSLLGKSWCL